jgi:FtsH-binding integral membrane protein
MSMFLAIDTQMLMGNKRYAFDPEDYINAAVQLYLDVCYMFMYLLQAFGGK